MKRSESTRVENKRPPRLRTLLPAMLGTVAAAVVAVFVVLSVTPPDFTDAEALAMLPEGAELLERHELSQGRVQQLEYRYTEEHEYCLVERTERAPFRYAKGVWSRDGEAEVLSETEDWSGLAGYWTEQTEGPWGRFLRLRVDGFDGGALTGQVLYQDASASCEGPAEELFPAGEKADGEQSWLLRGTGFFRYGYLRVERDGGVYFDNDVRPMKRSELPTEPPPAVEPEAEDEELPENAAEGGERTWLVVTEELSVRRTPDTDGEPVATAAVGEVLSGVAAENGWYQVERDDGTGYVPGDGVLALTEDMTVGVAAVWADVNVRAGPGQEYEAVGVAGAGARLVYTGLEENWYRVIYDGQAAYVAGGYVTAEPITPPEE